MKDWRRTSERSPSLHLVELASIEDERGIDAVEVGAGSERQERLARRRAWGRTSREPQVREDAAGEARILDESQDVHGAAAVRADQRVDGKAPFQERGPLEPAGAYSVIGAGGVAAVYNGRVMLLMLLRNSSDGRRRRRIRTGKLVIPIASFAKVAHSEILKQETRYTSKVIAQWS